MKEVCLANFYFWTSDLEKKTHKTLQWYHWFLKFRGLVVQFLSQRHFLVSTNRKDSSPVVSPSVPLNKDSCIRSSCIRTKGENQSRMKKWDGHLVFLIVEKEFPSHAKSHPDQMTLKIGDSTIWTHAQNALEKNSYIQAAAVDRRFLLRLQSVVWMSTEAEHTSLDRFLLRPVSGTGKE